MWVQFPPPVLEAPLTRIAKAGKIVCVDINPAVATKVSDRGTGQAVGVVTDVGLFLDLLAKALA